MPIPQHSTLDYFFQFQRLLPRGRVWHRGWGTIQAEQLLTLMPTWARLDARAGNLIIDAFPCSTRELLPEWEATLGLPDPCTGPLGTLQERMEAVCLKFTARGGQSREYFERLAASLGYTIEIATFRPFEASRSAAGEPLYDEAWAYAWRITLIGPDVARYFAASVNTAGDPLAVYGGASLICTIEALKPAHTTVIFSTLDPLYLNFMTPGALDPRVTFSRASTATYLDSAGTMRTAAVNAPRWDYDPATKALRGLLLEEPRTNDIANSSTANPAFGAVASTDVPALMPGATVWKATTGAGGAVLGAFIGLPIPANQSTTASYWVWVPSAYDATIDGPPHLDMDGNFGTGSSDMAAVADMSKRDRWQRISTTANATADPGPYYNFVVRNSAPNGGGNVFYFCCFQSERGAFPTSYIPTGASATTRATDSATFTISDRHASAETFMAEYMFFYTPAAVMRIIGSLGTGDTVLYNESGARVASYDGTGNVLTANAQSIGSPNKAASTWSSPNNASVCLNGGAVAKSTTLTDGFSAVSMFVLLNSNGGEAINGYIRQFRYWPYVLSDEEMQAVTA